jgi:hypothetical protein
MISFRRAARGNALFSIEQARVEIMRCHRIITVIYSFKAGIILFVQAIENEGGELIITKGLTNGGESICQTLSLVEEGSYSEVALLEFIQLSANSHGTFRRL